MVTEARTSDRDPTVDESAHGQLTLWILGAIVLAVISALVLPHQMVKFQVGGEIFLRLLKMMVVPLVVTSVMSGILGLGDVRRLGRPGIAAVAYYLSTTVLAVLVGLIMVNVIRPGVGTIDESTLTEIVESRQTEDARLRILESLSESAGVSEDEVGLVFDELAAPGDDTSDIGIIFENLLLMVFTDNLFASAARTDLLPLIVFSIIFGGMLTTLGDRVRGLTELIDQANDALMAFVMLLMKAAPLGIFCLVAARFGQAQAEGKFLEVLSQTGWYVATVLGGLAVHAFGTLPLILWVFTRRNPYRFMLQMSQALLTAYSTASSSATLPITMKCATGRAGISERSAEFVIPLGATINMDGTALYEAVAAIFIAQAIPGFELGFTQQIIIAVTATLAAIGAAGIPEAGLVTMLIVLNAVGLPLEYIGLILSVDWFLDRFRTAVNAFGDSVGAAVVEKAFDVPLEGEASADV